MHKSVTEKDLKLEAVELVSKLATTTPTEKERRQILDWRTQSSQHENAWVEAEKVWELMSQLNTEELTAPIPQIKVVNFKLSRWQSYAVPAGIAACLLLACSIFFLIPQTKNSAPVTTAFIEPIEIEQYSNKRRDQYSVNLSDGSIVHLNYNSSIKISFNSGTRNVELIQGEAFFEVAKNPNRPFVVQAGDTLLKAVGTAFVVRRQGLDVTQVTVTEGMVEVAQVHNQDGGTITLAINETVTSSAQSIGDVQLVDANNAATWHRGVLVFRDTPISDALNEISRYTPYRIEANFSNWPVEQVTGTFFINRLDEDLSALISSFNLVVLDNQNGVLKLGQPRPQKPGAL